MDLMQTIKANLSNKASRATTYLLFLLIVLIPFSVRHVFESVWNYQTGAYSDFTSLSLYINDLVLIALIFSFILGKIQKKFILPKIWIYAAVASVVWVILELFLQSKQYLPLQTYFSIRLIFLIAFAAIVSQIEVSREKIAWLFTGLGAIQALIAVVQFYSQRSIGLYKLDESHLSPTILGVAKIVSHGTTLIRGYGTFPHSNLLSAFLVASILFNLYLITKTYQIPRGEEVPRGTFQYKKPILYTLLLLNTFGLFVSFSRGGILGLGVGLVVLAGYFLINKRHYHIKQVILPIILTVGISIAILAPYLSTRTTITDNSTKERLFYDEIGEKMIATNPFAGLGPGTSVLHMKQYTHEQLQSWEIQPIHNYYLISWAEWGIGAIFFLFLILYPIFALFKRNMDEWQLILGAIGLSFLVLFLFDHYFYTIWPTQLLLWLIVGLALKACSMWNTSERTQATYDKLSQS